MMMLQEIASLLTGRWDFFAGLLWEHLEISLVAILIAVVFGGAVGILISEFQRSARPTLGLINFLYTIPSISMLGFLIPFSGVGNATAVIALTVYALLPMVRNTHTGLTNVDPAILEAAKGMGSTRLQILFRIRLPLAMPVILSGIRSMVTMTIALAGIASFIGAGGLGVAIYRGITTNNAAMTMAGSLLIAALALVMDFLLGFAEKRLQKRSIRAKKANRVIGAAAVLACIGIICGMLFQPQTGDTIRIATKPMTEQYVLGEMLDILIEQDTDLNVELTQGVGGGTSNIEPGMEKGDFDLYPEYTGTGWNAVLKHDDTYDESMFDTMQQEYESQLGLTWVGMYGFNNTFGLAVSRDAAERYNLRTYSDLAGAAGDLTLGAEPDFFDRQDGYPGLQQAYGMNFGNTRDMDISLKYQALFEGQVDAIVVSTTDGQVADERLVVLEDDRHFYPSYLCGNVVRQDALEKHPELRDELLKLQGAITDTNMARMNNEVETQGQEPKAVADAFLAEKGLM